MKKTSVVFSVILNLLMLNSVAQQFVWTQKANFTPGNRYGAFHFSIGNYGYLGSGVMQNGTSITLINDFWEYDALADVWSQKATLPASGRLGASSFEIDGKGYITTGFDLVSTYFNDTWEYDPSANSWLQKANFAGGVRYTCASFVIGNTAYVGMGKYGGYFSDFFSFNPLTNTWGTIASIPGQLRQSARGFALSGFGFVVGGANQGTNYNSYDLWQYDPQNNTWLQKTSYPGNASYGNAVFILNSRAFLGTGSKLVTTGQSTFDDFYFYDPVIDTWTATQNFAGGTRQGSSFMTIGNKAYVGLGSSDVFPNINYQNDWWSFADVTTVGNTGLSISNYTVSYSADKIIFSVKEIQQQTNFSVTDLSGKIIYRQTLRSLTSSLQVDKSLFAKGVYIARFSSKHNDQNLKFLINS